VTAKKRPAVTPTLYLRSLQFGHLPTTPPTLHVHAATIKPRCSPIRKWEFRGLDKSFDAQGRPGYWTPSECKDRRPFLSYQENPFRLEYCSIAMCYLSTAMPHRSSSEPTDAVNPLDPDVEQSIRGPRLPTDDGDFEVLILWAITETEVKSAVYFACQAESYREPLMWSGLMLHLYCWELRQCDLCDILQRLRSKQFQGCHLSNPAAATVECVCCKVYSLSFHHHSTEL